VRDGRGGCKLSRMQDAGKIGRSKKRQRRSSAAWAEEVRRWRESGQSAAEYAAERDLHAGTLAGWASKVKRGGRRQRRSAFVALRVAERPAIMRAKAETGELEVVLLNGRRVRISGNVESEAVARVLAIAEGSGAC